MYAIAIVIVYHSKILIGNILICAPECTVYDC